MKRKINFYRIIIGVILINSSVVSAEEQTKDLKVNCGDIIKSEFSKSQASHHYGLYMKPEDSFIVEVNAIGEHFFPRLDVYEPGKTKILASNRFGSGRKVKNKYKSGVLSGRGDYIINVRNYYHHSGSGQALNGVLGSYYLKIGCNVDGLEIMAGSVSKTTTKAQLLSKIKKIESELSSIKVLVENAVK